MFHILQTGNKKFSGFTLLETVIALAIFLVVLFFLFSAFSVMNTSDSKTTADREASENAQALLNEIVFEVRSAKSIYTPTTTQNQLSLETSRYMPAGQDDTFIDFFQCGSAVCLKKEFQDAVALSPSSVQVTNLSFSQVATGTGSSVQISLTVNSDSGDEQNSSITLTSAASPRSY